jgi:hypothetical protein
MESLARKILDLGSESAECRLKILHEVAEKTVEIVRIVA